MRKAAGISQEQLVEQLDVSCQSISKWEFNDVIPEIIKIIIVSELFSVSTDELLKDSSMQNIDETNTNTSTSTLEQITKMNAANKQVNLGFKTIVTGLILLVLEFMFLPVFGALQKAHANGQGYYSNFIRYAGIQPMSIIFGITVCVIVVGVVFLSLGQYSKKTQHWEMNTPHSQPKLTLLKLI